VCIPSRSTVQAVLSGYDRAAAGSIKVRSTSPVLALCRALIAAGYNPEARLVAYRGSTAALEITKIRAGARLEISCKGAEFVPFRGARSPADAFDETGAPQTTSKPFNRLRAVKALGGETAGNRPARRRLSHPNSREPGQTREPAAVVRGQRPACTRP
jgi:hypothetical protein